MPERALDAGYIGKHTLMNLFTDMFSSHWAFADIMEAIVTHAHAITNGKEAWESYK